MAALASAARADDTTPDVSLSGIDMGAILAASRMARPDAALIREIDAGVTPQSRATSFAALDEKVERLAGFLAGMRCKPGSRVLITAPMGGACVIAMLASLRAGLTPAFAPCQTPMGDLVTVVEQIEAQVGIGVDRVGDLTPLVTLRDTAARTFSLRLAAGFGPDCPDGVASIDQVLAEPAARPLATVPAHELLLTDPATGFGARHPVSESELIESALEVARALRPSPYSRVVTTLVGTDRASWATGFGLALLAGMEFMPLGLFRLSHLWASLADGVAVQLVAPAALEDGLRRAGIVGHRAVAGLVLVHPPGAIPQELAAPGRLSIVDVAASASGGLVVRRR